MSRSFGEGSLSHWSTTCIEEAIIRFLNVAHVQKKDLAKALGISPEYLSFERIRRWPSPLWESLHLSRLEQAARYLRLDPQRYQALLRLSIVVDAHIRGPRLRPYITQAGRSGAAKIAQLGIELFHDGEWELAERYFDQAWPVLVAPPPTPTNRRFPLVLEAGHFLVERRTQRRQSNEVRQISRVLHSMVVGYHGTDPASSRAVGRAQKGVSYAARHDPLTHPRVAAEWSWQAFEVHRARGLDARDQSAALRNYVKSKGLWAIGVPGIAKPRPDHFEDALGAIRHARDLLGGAVPREGCEEEWLVGGWTECEVLVTMGRYDEALRLWETTQAQNWVAPYLAHCHQTMLLVKLEYMPMPVALARGGPEALAISALEAQSNPRMTLYPDRIIRAGEMVRAVETGDLLSALRAFYR